MRVTPVSPTILIYHLVVQRSREAKTGGVYMVSLTILTSHRNGETHTMKKIEFQSTRNLILQNSFGVIDEQESVLLDVTIGINSDTYGWFEFYDKETGGSEWYAEGSLQFENNKLIGYDGVFCLSDFIVDKLEEIGYDVSEMRDSLS